MVILASSKSNPELWVQVSCYGSASKGAEALLQHAVQEWDRKDGKTAYRDDIICCVIHLPLWI